jgi:hypothetical protein
MKTLDSAFKKRLTVCMLLTIVASILLAFMCYAIYLSGEISANFGFIALIITQVAFTAMNCLWFSNGIKDEEFTGSCRSAWGLVLLFLIPPIYFLRETGASDFIYVSAFMPLFMTALHWAEWCVKNVQIRPSEGVS